VSSSASPAIHRLGLPRQCGRPAPRSCQQLARRPRRSPRIDVRDRSFDIRPLGFHRLPVQFDRLEQPAQGRPIIRAPAITLQCIIVSPFRGEGLPASPHRGVCVAGGEGKAGRSWILIPRWSELSTQVDEAFDHSLGCLEHLLEFGLPLARALRTTQVVAKQQFVKRCVCHPRPCFLKQNLTLHSVFRPCSNLAGQYAPNGLGIIFFAIIIDEREASVSQLIEIPKIACPAVFAEPHNEKIVSSTFNQFSLIPLRQEPDVRSPIWRLIAREKLLLDLLWLDTDQSLAKIATDNLVALKCVTGCAIAGANPERRLVHL